jgi:hypothetical protein
MELQGSGGPEAFMIVSPCECGSKVEMNLVRLMQLRLTLDSFMPIME